MEFIPAYIGEVIVWMQKNMILIDLSQENKIKNTEVNRNL